MFSSRMPGTGRYVRHFPGQAYLCLAAFLLFAFLPGRGVAEISVAPRLVELTYKDRSKSLHVINTGTETRTYRISLHNYRMKENGQIELTETETGQDRFADKLIRYSPRQVTLKPGEIQTVRVLIRRSANLEDGEYRSHLLFRRLPEPPPPARNGADRSKLDIKVEAIFGITIPVIIHLGNLTATAEITHVQFIETEQGKPALSMHIERAGNRSVRGNLTVTANGKEIARINNLAVYLSVPYRQIVVPLEVEESLKGQKLVIEYHKNNKDGGTLITSSEKIIR